jgi:hypothetical protein
MTEGTLKDLGAFSVSQRVGFYIQDLDRIRIRKVKKQWMKDEFLRFLAELKPYIEALEATDAKRDARLKELEKALDAGYKKLSEIDYVDVAYTDSFEGGLSFAIDFLKRPYKVLEGPDSE